MNERPLHCRWRVTLAAIAVAYSLGLPTAFAEGRFAGLGDAARQDVPRQLQLIQEPGRLLASNARLGRIDEWLLDDDESVLKSASANAVLAAVTDRRVLAYGPVIGWREFTLDDDERVESMEAEDYALFISTDRRYLNFSADTGVWAQTDR